MQPLSLFLSPFFLPGGAAGDELSLPPDLQSRSATMKGENKAVAASDGARRSKRAFQLAEAAPAAAAEDIRLGRKTGREVGNREEGSSNAPGRREREAERATEGETRVEVKNQIPLKDGKNIAATAAAAAAEAGAKSGGGQRAKLPPPP